MNHLRDAVLRWRPGGDRDADLREKAAVARADPKQIGSAQVRGGQTMVSLVAAVEDEFEATASRASPWETPAHRIIWRSRTPVQQFVACWQVQVSVKA